MSERARRSALVGVLLAAAAFFAVWVSRFYPIHRWLFWRYLGYWFGAGVWATACASFGHRVLARVFGDRLRKSEHLMLSAPVGALAFGLSIFLVGLAHGLNVVLFFALPGAFLAFGARGLTRDLRRLAARLRGDGDWRVSAWTVPALVFATVAFGLLYIQTLHPQGLTFDARWYHMTIAQRYALSGKVWPFPEGYWNAAWPHLFSYEYAWAFLAPLPMVFDRIMLCVHLEVVVFVMTLAQVPVVVRRLVPNAKTGLTWLVFLMFPGIYLYDSNLNGGADHFAGFFALPVALAFFRAYRAFELADVALCTTLASAAALTKYTALPIALVPSIVLFARGAWLAARRQPGALRALGAMVGIAMVLTAPNWLANIIWYGDPVYPMLHGRFPSHPYVEDVKSQLKFLHGTSRPGSLTPMGLLEALGATFSFSFVPNDWFNFHRDVPVFGSLFTLTIPALPFLRGARRVAWLYAMTMAALFLWYLISHLDRYLQDVLPWMVAATASTIVLLYRTGGWARLAIAPLIALQCVWGSDVPFIATHNQIGDSALRNSAKFLATGYEQQHNRLRVFEPMPTIGDAVPKDAVLLTHDTILILGTDRNWASDLHQTRISYGLLVSPKAIYGVLKDVGVTHLAWPANSIGRDTIAGDLAFANFATNWTRDQQAVAGYTVATMPASPPTDARDDYDVAFFSCGGAWRSGMYRLSQLRVPVIDSGAFPTPRAPLAHDPGDAMRAADFVVLDRACYADVHPGADFKLATNRNGGELWVRLRK